MGGSRSQTTNTKQYNEQNSHTKNHDIKSVTYENNWNENTREINNHNGGTYMNGVTDLSNSMNKGVQSFDLSAGLMNLGALRGASTAIIATPEDAVALLEMNANLARPYQVKGAYMI